MTKVLVLMAQCSLTHTVVTCSGLTSPGNGSIVLGNVVFKSEALYSCNEGFKINGPATRTCQATGLWTGEAPTCEGLSIYEPPFFMVQNLKPDCLKFRRNLMSPAAGLQQQH